jgi:hypothetical protein
MLDDPAIGDTLVKQVGGGRRPKAIWETSVQRASLGPEGGMRMAESTSSCPYESPKWTDAQIAGGVQEVKRHMEGRFGIAKLKKETGGKSRWWAALQTNPTEAQKYVQLGWSQDKVEAYVKDAERVLPRIKRDWCSYITRVQAQRRVAGADKITKLAQQGPGKLYIFLVGEHLWKAWGPGRHDAKKEASAKSIRDKIGLDNQFLWDQDQLKSIMP